MSPRQVAELIANGHAYQKHVVQQKEFPEVESVTAFVVLVQYVIVSGRKKTLSGGRVAYWSAVAKTVVIYPVYSPQNGTAFRPKTGEDYFNNLL
ncbi:MAG: hypothetical protein SNJ55_14300 [Chloroherpetonaceae bacterium]